jgi:hypothetical protein
MDPRVARLLDQREIENVLSAYCRGIDRRDLDLVRDCYHPDAIDEHGSFSGTVDAFLEWVDALLARYVSTMHLIGNLRVDFGNDADVAACETYGVAIHRSDEEKPHLNLATGFRYLDRFERRQGRWKIAARTAVTEWSIQIPAEAWWSVPDSMPTGKRDSTDPLYALLASLDRSA